MSNLMSNMVSNGIIHQKCCHYNLMFAVTEISRNRKAKSSNLNVQYVEAVKALFAEVDKKHEG